MVKLTKRKGFNFFRSYYDVYNELNNNNKLQFINALLNKQFLGIEPDGLTGMAKFAYISQMNNINAQVKGFEDKTGIQLFNPPSQGGAVGGKITPTEQVIGKVIEKGEYIYSEFYDIELKESNEDYKKYVKFIFGANDIEQKFTGILSIKNQLSFKNFETLIPMFTQSKTTFKDALMGIENNPKYYKGRKQLYTILLNWVKRDL
jgi:hypothetical protein